MIEKILAKFEELTAFSHPFINEKLVCKNDVLKIVQEVAKDGGWIPCSERLPEEDERVLCFHEHNFIDFGVLIGGTWYCDMDEYAIHRDNVIAWQPLPAPYQNGE